MFDRVIPSLDPRGVDRVVARSAYAVLGAAGDLHSGLRARGARARRSHLSMIAFLRVLHVFTLNVFIFNLVILKVVLHELIQLVE